MREDTLPLSHFEAIYSRGPDPWRFASSGYEQAKYAATLAALPRTRYADAFEVGCSIGVFTGMLAARCDNLLAVEPVASALDDARRRNAGLGHIRFAGLFVPVDWPSEHFDLIVLSEVLDYLGRDDLLRTAERIRESLRDGGDLVLVHWVGKKRRADAAPDEPSEVLIDALGTDLAILTQHRNPDYRLDVLTRTAQSAEVRS